MCMSDSGSVLILAFCCMTEIIIAGSEFDYIILSTVYSIPTVCIEKFATREWLNKKLGQLCQHRLIITALTRAKKGLFIVGK